MSEPEPNSSLTPQPGSEPVNLTVDPVPRLNWPVSIPDHTLIRRIGKGSYGEVWIARSILGVYRAVKIIDRRVFDDDRPFEREFAGIQRFEPVSRTHESQLNILHVGRGANYFYYVMELADDMGQGSTIDESSYSPRSLRSELLFRGRLPVDECIRLGLALSTALEHLHRHGLVHRDIKPTNITELPDRAAFAELNEVLLRACAPDVKLRYESAADLHVDLALLQSGKSVARMRAVERRLKRVVRRTALVTAFAILAALAFFYQRHPTAEARRLEEGEYTFGTGGPVRTSSRRSSSTTPDVGITAFVALSKSPPGQDCHR